VLDLSRRSKLKPEAGNEALPLVSLRETWRDLAPLCALVVDASHYPAITNHSNTMHTSIPLGHIEAHPHSALLLLPPRSLFLTVIALGCFAVSPTAKSQLPPPAPDGGYPGQNTAEGQTALLALTSGTFNTAIGYQALASNTTGDANTAVGGNALVANTSGTQNTSVGNASLHGNLTGSFNTAIGGGTLFFSDADNNTATGYSALESNRTGNDNTAIGANALLNNTSGEDNTAAGSSALQGNTIGNDNTAIGFEVLLNNTSGTANTASGLHAMQFNTTGSDNTAGGLIALQSNTTGAENTALGAFALAGNTTGKNNTAEGSAALANSTTGSNNVAMGFDAGLNLKSGSNNIDIGANVVGNASDANTIRIGKQGTQKSAFIAGIFGTVMTGSPVVINSSGKLGVSGTSSIRFKEAVKPMEKASETILALNPVTFRYKEEIDPDGIPQFGLVAEEVEKVNPDLITRDEEGKPTAVRYEAVNAMLLNEFLKEHRQVRELKGTVAQQQKQIEALTATVQKVSEKLERGKIARRVVEND
jgi:Chaperone of endosialidase